MERSRSSTPTNSRTPPQTGSCPTSWPKKRRAWRKPSSAHSRRTVASYGLLSRVSGVPPARSRVHRHGLIGAGSVRRTRDLVGSGRGRKQVDVRVELERERLGSRRPDPAERKRRTVFGPAVSDGVGPPVAGLVHRRMEEVSDVPSARAPCPDVGRQVAGVTQRAESALLADLSEQRLP